MRSALVVCLLIAPLAALAGGGSIAGSIGPTTPKHSVVWLEGLPAGSWSPPKESPALSQRGARFAPDFLVITVGQTVLMPNDDKITHNVFSVSPPKKFDLGHYAHGETRSVKFDKPGVIDIFCNIHENMHSTLVVAPSTYWTIPGSDGKFIIGNVPPGVYRVTAYSPANGTVTGEVTVREGQAAPLLLAWKPRP